MYCSTTRSPPGRGSRPWRRPWCRRLHVDADRRRLRPQDRCPGMIGLMEVHVLLAVHHEHEHFGRQISAIAPAIASQIGTTANTGGASSPARARGSGRSWRGVRLGAFRLDLEVLLVGPLPDLSMANCISTPRGLRRRRGAAALLSVPVGPRCRRSCAGRPSLQPLRQRWLTRHLIDPVRAVVDALERRLQLCELLFELLEDRDVLLALELSVAVSAGCGRSPIAGELVALGPSPSPSFRLWIEPFDAGLLSITRVCAPVDPASRRTREANPPLLCPERRS